MSTGAGAVSRRMIGFTVALGVVLAAAVAGVYFGFFASPAGAQVIQARVTGYASASLSSESSGPVSVTLDGAPAAGLYRIIQGLPGSGGPDCMEDALLYRIAFTTDAGGTIDVSGYECVGFVSEKSGLHTSGRTDSDCTLLLAVRRVLPATAKATQRWAPPCPS